MLGSKLNNVVRIIGFKDDMDIYNQLDRFLLHHVEKENQSLTVKNIQILDDTHALVYMEEDMNTIACKFILNYEEISLKNSPFDTLLLPIKEIELMKSLGEVNIEDTLYDIEEVRYSVNSVGGRYVTIYLA